MARNEEKHFCNLNKLILLKEKEEYEKAHPSRPKLNTLDSPEDIQKWLPSIKKDIDFYLKKSQVTCYSDAHVEECREKVVKLEKEFKAFVRKIKQLAPSPSDVIPWTSRPYKRKKTSVAEETSFKEFKRIATPILDDEKGNHLSNEDNITLPGLYSENNNFQPTLKEDSISQYDRVNWNLMDQPLFFSAVPPNQKKADEAPETEADVCIPNIETRNWDVENTRINQNEIMRRTDQMKRPLLSKTSQHKKSNQSELVHRIVNYDSSDEEIPDVLQ